MGQTFEKNKKKKTAPASASTTLRPVPTWMGKSVAIDLGADTSVTSNAFGALTAGDTGAGVNVNGLTGADVCPRGPDSGSNEWILSVFQGYST